MFFSCHNFASENKKNNEYGDYHNGKRGIPESG